MLTLDSPSGNEKLAGVNIEHFRGALYDLHRRGVMVELVARHRSPTPIESNGPLRDARVSRGAQLPHALTAKSLSQQNTVPLYPAVFVLAVACGQSYAALPICRSIPLSLRPRSRLRRDKDSSSATYARALSRDVHVFATKSQESAWERGSAFGLNASRV
jgi:hypothetical protein